MNAIGCDSLTRTDQLLLYEVPQGTCEVPIIGYAVWSAIVILFRIIVIINAWRAWIKKYSKQRGRLPIQPVLISLTTIIQILFLILSGVDVISSTDGTTGLIFGIWGFLYYTQAGFGLKKVVSLGTKIAYVKPLAEVTYSSSNSSPSAVDRTSKFDMILKIVGFLSIVCGIVATIFFCIIGVFVYPGARYSVQAGFICTGTFILLICGAGAWQTERIVRHIRSSNSASPNDSILGEANRRLRFQQMIFIILGLWEGIIQLLHGTGVLPLTWIWVLIHCSADIGFMLSFGIVFTARKCFRRNNQQIQEQPTATTMAKVQSQVSSRYFVTREQDHM